MPMALQSIRRPSRGNTRLSSPPQSAQAGSYVSRISPADELQLACRLAECRRELAAIALLDADMAVELQRLATELASGARRVGDLLEAVAATAAEAGAEFRQFSDRALALQREASLLLRASHGHSAFGALEDEALESLSLRMLELVKAHPLTSDLTDRLLQASWTAHHAEGGPLAMPRPLRAKVRRLEGEIETIRSRFIHANQGLVAHVVQRYRGMGLRRDDLMQEGNIGLLRAIEKFDHRRGTRFSVYAVWWIRQAVRRALANQSRTIRIPVHALAVRYALDQA